MISCPTFNGISNPRISILQLFSSFDVAAFRNQSISNRIQPARKPPNLHFLIYAGKIRSYCCYPPSVSWWNSSIKEQVRNRCFTETISIYKQMIRFGVKPDNYTLPHVLKACSELSVIDVGKDIHLYVSSGEFNPNVFVYNALVAMYAKCGLLDVARQVFDGIPQKDIISWNSIVMAYVQNGDLVTGLSMFLRMTEGELRFRMDLRPNGVSLSNVLPACASMGYGKGGKEIHGYAIRRGLCADLFVSNAIIDMYCKCGMIGDALKVFDLMEEKDVVSWNAMVTGYSQNGEFEKGWELLEEMRSERIPLNVVTWSAVIAGYAQRGRGEEALAVFRMMHVSGMKENVVTLVSLFSACAAIGALRQGKEAHGHVIRCYLGFTDYEEKLMLNNAVIDMYAKCMCEDLAQAMFNLTGMPSLFSGRNVVTWTVMIAGYVQNGNANQALGLFSRMYESKMMI